MIYNEIYKIRFYRNSWNGARPVDNYINSLDPSHGTKIYKYIEFLRERGGYLDEPYGRHIIGKIRELRVDFANNRYRILYFCFVGKSIVILHAFLKKTAATPVREINIALKRYNEIINNPKLYETQDI